MEKAFEYRIYPNAEQDRMIQQTFGCCRYVYNRALAIRKEAYEKNEKVPSLYDCCKMIPSWKADPETAWLKDVPATALQSSLRDLDRAYQNFFRSPGKIGFPKFKSKRNRRRTYRTNNVNDRSIRIEDERHVRLPKLGSVKTRVDRMPEGRILSATVKQVPSGKYFVVLCCTDCETESLPKNDCSVGVDLGVKELATLSDGTVFANPKNMAKYQKKLAREQRKLSRKKKGSKNREKQRVKVARVHEKITNSRKDSLHKATTSIIRENQTVAVESLNVKGMVRNHKLAKAVSDASFGEFVRQLEYKASWYGRQVVKIDRWFPSSKTCSNCGHVQHMPLSKRTYQCPSCGMKMDRDLNAAINILQEGQRIVNGTVDHTGTSSRLRANAFGENVSPCEAQSCIKANLDEERISVLEITGRTQYMPNIEF